jgi:hypothetical protein
VTGLDDEIDEDLPRDGARRWPVKPTSDRSLAEMLAARLRAAGLFELFIRELAPGEWYASARGFTPDGRRFDASARDTDVQRVLLALLSEIERARAAPRSSPQPEPPRARTVEPTQPEPPRRPRTERVALELAARLDGFTLQTFVAALGYGFTESTEGSGFIGERVAEVRARLSAVLGELVASGELRHDGHVYRRASGAVQTSALGSEASDAAV